MRLTQRMELSQRLLLELQQELALKLGQFEKQILDKVKLPDIDLDDDDSQYHIDMLRALVVRGEDEQSLLGRITAEAGMTEKDIQRIRVESFRQEDVSFDIGTQRNVDLVTLEIEGGKEAVMTVSMDREEVEDIVDSPSYSEYEAISDVDSEKSWCVQDVYGFTEVESAEGVRGLICKEFLPGQMLEDILIEAQVDPESVREGLIETLAAQAGRMIANALQELGGVPTDSNGLNIIVPIAEITDKTRLRYCDVEDIRTDAKGLKHEITLLKKQFGKFGDAFMQAIREHYKGDLLEGIEFE